MCKYYTSILQVNQLEHQKIYAASRMIEATEMDECGGLQPVLKQGTKKRSQNKSMLHKARET